MKRTAKHYREILMAARRVHADPELFCCKAGLTVKDYARQIMVLIDDLEVSIVEYSRDHDDVSLWLSRNLRFPWETTIEETEAS